MYNYTIDDKYLQFDVTLLTKSYSKQCSWHFHIRTCFGFFCMRRKEIHNWVWDSLNNKFAFSFGVRVQVFYPM